MKRPRHTIEDRVEAVETQHADYVKVLSSHAATTAALQQTTAALQQTTATLQQQLAAYIADSAAFRMEIGRRFDSLEELVRSKGNGHDRE